MRLAYSALSQNTATDPVAPPPPSAGKNRSLRYRGYKAACKKYRQEIAAIQQYLPGWQPAFDLQ